MKSLLFCLLILLGTSCASIMHGTKQDINISSNPSQATISVNEEEYGKTPRIINLKRKGDNYKIKLELEGYEPYEIKLERKTDGWFWGNILLGGIIGIIVDASNGAMYKLKPEQITSTLSPSGTASIEHTKDVLYISAQLEIDPNWEMIGVIDTIRP